MGRYGQAILTIGGAIIGSYFGYPQLGAALGSIAGSLLFPPKLPTVSGPRLADISSTSSAVGVPIPEIWGTMAVAGTVIHQLDVQEVITSEDVGGKGGPSQTVETASYYQTFAVALCDCPDDPIQGVRRIWANGKPIYDRTPQGDDESDSAFQQRMVANTRLDAIMTIYLGTDSQLPDPALEAFYGVDGVSAHLNLAYIVFTEWQNKAEDGNRMPAQWKFEVYTNGSASAGISQEYANEVIYPWNQVQDEEAIENPRNIHSYVVMSNGIYDSPPGTFNTSAAALSACDAIRHADPNSLAGGPSNFLGHWIDGWPMPQKFEGGVGVISKDATQVNLMWNPQSAARALFVPDTGAGTCAQIDFLFHSGTQAAASPVWTQGVGVFFSDSPLRVIVQSPDTDALAPGFDFLVPCSAFPYDYQSAEDFMLRVTRVRRAPDNPCNPRGLPNPPCADPPECDWCIVDGRIRADGPWTLQSGGAFAFHVLASYAEDNVDGINEIVQYPLTPVRPQGHAEYDDQDFWEAAYEIAVAERRMPGGLTYGVHFPANQSFGYVRDIETETITVAPVNVADIVEALCRRSGMSADQIDVEDLDGLTVNGYCRTRQMSARVAIDPLRQAKFFDGYESGRTLRFVRRGGPVRYTFTNDELGIVSGESDANTVVRVQTRTAQDVDLPRSVRVHYMSISRDYEPGEQQSPKRVETDAVNDVDVDLPISMEDSEAKQIAQVLWADAWASRNSHEIIVDVEHQALEPTDCVGVPIDGFVQRCRIVEMTDQLPTARRFSLVRDDDGAYESFAVADPPVIVPRPPIVYAPIEMVPLDIPLLRDEDDAPGFYVATRSTLEDGFRGGAIYRSVDGGGNFTRMLSTGNEATIGEVLELLPAPSDHTVPDGVNHVRVRLQSGDLSSITEAAMLAGGSGSNAAAIGDHGRWEIVQFQTVEQLTDDIYLLTTLLRGRRGTEHAMGTHTTTSDRFVLLSGAGIYRAALQLSELGREFVYRAVGNGQQLDATENQLFTCAGVCLKPFSPVFIQGDRDPATGAWAITWIRRGRVGKTLMDDTDIPLSEDLEDYEVVLLDEFGVERRVISITEPAAAYSSAQQITDFGAVQSTLRVNVYQISAQVGRGYVGAATLTATEPLA